MELLFRSWTDYLIFFIFSLLLFIFCSFPVPPIHFLGGILSFCQSFYWIFCFANAILISKSSFLLLECLFDNILFLFLDTISFISLSTLENFPCFLYHLSVLLISLYCVTIFLVFRIVLFHCSKFNYPGSVSDQDGDTD